MIASGIDACIATVIERQGSAPSTPGQKLVIGADGTAVGSVGGGAVEREAIERMQTLLAQGGSQPVLDWYALAADLSMACGGRVQLLFEPMPAATPALLIGAGHIGFALCQLLPRLGFRVVITDSRPGAADPDRFQGVPGVVVRSGHPDAVASDIPVSAPVVAATHAHALDEAAVVWAVERGHAYVGCIGSKGKAHKIREALTRQGLPKERILAVRMPIGVAIGGRSPEEIAVSIAAELIAWRAGKL